MIMVISILAITLTALVGMRLTSDVRREKYQSMIRELASLSLTLRTYAWDAENAPPIPPLPTAIEAMSSNPHALAKLQGGCPDVLKKGEDAWGRPVTYEVFPKDDGVYGEIRSLGPNGKRDQDDECGDDIVYRFPLPLSWLPLARRGASSAPEGWGLPRGCNPSGTPSVPDELRSNK